MLKKNKVYVVILMCGLLFLCGCKSTPSDVKKRMESYGDNSQTDSEDIKYCSVSDLNKTNIKDINVDLDNMVLPDKIDFSDVQSISLLDMSFEEDFAERNRESLVKLFNVDENSRIDDTEYLGAKTISYQNDKQELCIIDNGFLTYFSGLDFGDIGVDVYQKKFLAQYDTDNKKGVKKYSLGMRQRLGIAQALMEDPEILILDEPFNGLDKGMVQMMREVLVNEKQKGKTIILASHNENDIAYICDRIYEIDDGKIVGASQKDQYKQDSEGVVL